MSEFRPDRFINKIINPRCLNGFVYTEISLLDLNLFYRETMRLCLRPRSHGQFFFAADYLSQTLLAMRLRSHTANITFIT